MSWTAYPGTKLAARILLSLIFISSGVMKIANASATVQMMEARGIEAAQFFLAAAIVLELVGGLSILFGYYTRVGVAVLILFLAPTTLTMHNFWSYQGQEMQNQMQHFMKNVTILGGLLALSAAGAGRYSLDARGSRAATVVVRNRRATDRVLAR